VISEGVFTAEVMSAAMRSFLGHARALRVVLPRNEFDPQIIKGLADSMDLDVACIRHENHSHLTLPSSYEKSLHNLDNCTRRNFRYYEKLARTALDDIFDKRLRGYPPSTSVIYLNGTRKVNTTACEYPWYRVLGG
jgi:hypothetical protein